VDAAALATAMGCSSARAGQYIRDYNIALVAASCTTVNRSAMFAAQVGHESAGLVYMEEIASGAAYEGRKDLGNTQSGDGTKFKGRGPIQLTGRHNYGEFGKWAKSRGLVSDANYFVNNPTAVATSTWGFLAASWYWTVARPKINAMCDAGDLEGVTRAINGGTNGLADRRTRWDRCRRLGNALLPIATAGADALEEDDVTPEDIEKVAQRAAQVVWATPIEDLYTPQGGDTMPAFAALGWGAAHGAYARQGAQAALAEVVGLRVAVEKLSGALAAQGGGVDASSLQQAVRDGVAQALADSVEVRGQLNIAPRS